MNPFPPERSRRGELLLGAALALATLFTAVVLDLPSVATTLFPGLWIVLHADRRRCRAARRSVP